MLYADGLHTDCLGSGNKCSRTLTYLPYPSTYSIQPIYRTNVLYFLNELTAAQRTNSLVNNPLYFCHVTKNVLLRNSVQESTKSFFTLCFSYGLIEAMYYLCNVLISTKQNTF